MGHGEGWKKIDKNFLSGEYIFIYKGPRYEFRPGARRVWPRSHPDPKGMIFGVRRPPSGSSVAGGPASILHLGLFAIPSAPLENSLPHSVVYSIPCRRRRPWVPVPASTDPCRERDPESPRLPRRSNRSEGEGEETSSGSPATTIPSGDVPAGTATGRDLDARGGDPKGLSRSPRRPSWKRGIPASCWARPERSVGRARMAPTARFQWGYSCRVRNSLQPRLENG